MLHYENFVLHCLLNNMAQRLTLEKSKWGRTVLGPLLLVVLYIVGTSQLGFLYALGHDHDVQISHSQKEEKDPCHRQIYHNDVEAGCDHDVHLTVINKCDLCDFAVHVDKTLLTPALRLTQKLDQNFVSFYKSNLESYWAVLSSSRAPPTTN
jgi:hypothetical protein